MTGPEHYREAEHLLAVASKDIWDAAHVQRAQVHATLALAAATAMSHWNDPSYPPMPQADRLAWEKVASERPAEQARKEAGQLCVCTVCLARRC